MKKLNIEAVKVYFAQGGEECPFCGGTNLEGSSFDVEEGTTAQDMFCVDCEKEWVDTYKLAKVTYKGEDFEPNEDVTSALLGSLADLWTQLRAAGDQRRPEDVMGEIAKFIAEKRGDTKPLCGCGGILHHYDGLLGYEAMVCEACNQHFPVL